MTNPDTQTVTELVQLIQQFLAHQVDNNQQLGEAAKESLTVASECIEQAYRLDKKAPSASLLDVYRAHKHQQPTRPPAPDLSQPADLFAQAMRQLQQHMYPAAAAATPPPTTATATQHTQTAAGAATNSPAPSAPPRQRKVATEAERLAAESFKNQGNDLMKQDKYKEAYDSYTRAIEIDDNNAIYYSNRAAASSKLGDHHKALSDCKEAVEIDSNYSKAYGRMGLAYASLEEHAQARDAYIKAVELDPTNESYRNNLKIAEEKLAPRAAGAGPSLGSLGAALGGMGGANLMNMVQSVMGNPELMSRMARAFQDPSIMSAFGMGAAGANPAAQQPSTADTSSGHQESATTATGASQQSAPAQSDGAQAGAGAWNPLNMGGANQPGLPGGHQTVDLMQTLGRVLNQAFQPHDPNGNPPPGFS